MSERCKEGNRDTERERECGRSRQSVTECKCDRVRVRQSASATECECDRVRQKDTTKEGTVFTSTGRQMSGRRTCEGHAIGPNEMERERTKERETARERYT